MAQQKLTSTNRLKGVDASHYQGDVDWKKVKNAGYVFVILKATDGLGQDSTFSRNRAKATEAGLIVGAYHFYRPRHSVAAQVRNFLKTIGEVRKGELAPAGDFEQADLWSGISKKAAAVFVFPPGPKTLHEVSV